VVGGRLLPGLRDRAPELDAFHGAWVDAYIDLVDFGHRAEDCTHVPPNCVPTLTACAALPPGWPEAVAQRLVVAMIKARRFQDHPFYSLDWGPQPYRDTIFTDARVASSTTTGWDDLRAWMEELGFEETESDPPGSLMPLTLDVAEARAPGNSTGSRDTPSGRGGFRPFLPHPVQPVPVGPQAGRGQGARTACSRQEHGVDVSFDPSEPPMGSSPQAPGRTTSQNRPSGARGRVAVGSGRRAPWSGRNAELWRRPGCRDAILAGRERPEIGSRFVCAVPGASSRTPQG
jgi:hypothetical protein